jgi:hypothetical protein
MVQNWLRSALMTLSATSAAEKAPRCRQRSSHPPVLVAFADRELIDGEQWTAVSDAYRACLEEMQGQARFRSERWRPGRAL